MGAHLWADGTRLAVRQNEPKHRGLTGVSRSFCPFPHLAAVVVLADNKESHHMVTATKTTPQNRTRNHMAKKNGSAKAGKGTKKSQASNLPAEFKDNAELKNTLAKIEQQFGDGAIMPLGSRGEMVVEGISTGSLSLDIALGGVGIPRARVAEIYGPESSGKTTLALHAVAEAQKAGGIAAFIDAEHALDPSWAKKLGVQLETLLVSQPSSGEEAMHICEMLVRSNAVDIIVIDSVAALVPQKELDGEIGDTHVGLQARLMSQTMRKLTGAIAKSKASVIFINQIREKIGVMFGSPETTPGGRALKFYSSVRIDVRRISQLKDGDVVVGQRVRAKVVKNKVAPPFRIAEFDMMHKDGISLEGDVLDMAVDNRIVTRSGSWFRYNDEHLGQGKEKARAYLAENPEVTAELTSKVMEAVGFYGPDAEAMAEDQPNAEAEADAPEASSKQPAADAKRVDEPQAAAKPKVAKVDKAAKAGAASEKAASEKAASEKAASEKAASEKAASGEADDKS
jgi:recombination protein RecA